MSAAPTDANDSPESPQSEVSAPAPADSGEPIRGGRRLGDDPFLADEGLFWWLPRTFSLLVVAVALMLLGAHLFGGNGDDEPLPASAEADPQPEVAPPPSPPAVLAAAEALRIVPAVAPRAVGAVAQRERARSYNARRRALLQEAEALLDTLMDGAGATPESDRDRRALRDFVERMDTPAR
jgi:hypothetical protein